MSQTLNLIHLFRGNGNRLTLDLLTTKETQYMIGTKYTGRISDARKLGYEIIPHEDREHPGNNVYELANPDHEPRTKNCQCRKCVLFSVKPGADFSMTTALQLNLNV